MTPDRPLLLRRLRPVAALAAAVLVGSLATCAETSQAPAPAPTPAAPPTAASTLAEPVALIDGKPLTLRDVEDALLKKEGVEQVEELMHQQLGRVDWAALRDDSVVVQVADWRLTRGLLAVQLLRDGSAKVREELINIRLVEAALVKEGVVIDAAAIDAEVGRMAKRLQESLKARGQPQVDFPTFIQQTQKMTIAQFTAEPGFRMLTGLHLLVARRAHAEIEEDGLKAWFVEHIDRYRQPEAIDLSSLWIPYAPKDKDGKAIPPEVEHKRLMEVMVQLHGTMTAGRLTFEQVWNTFGKGYDPNLVDGHLGFVPRSGDRGELGARVVEPMSMSAAWAINPPYPQMLPPIAGATGVEILIVHGRRPAKEPVFAELKERILQDVVDAEIEPRTTRLLGDLRRASTIDYKSLPALVNQRLAETGVPAAPGK